MTFEEIPGLKVKKICTNWLEAGKSSPILDTIEQNGLHWSDALFPHQRVWRRGRRPCGARHSDVLAMDCRSPWLDEYWITGGVQDWSGSVRPFREWLSSLWNKVKIHSLERDFTLYREIWPWAWNHLIRSSGGGLQYCRSLMITNHFWFKQRRKFKRLEINYVTPVELTLLLFWRNAGK